MLIQLLPDLFVELPEELRQTVLDQNYYKLSQLEKEYDKVDKLLTEEVLTKAPWHIVEKHMKRLGEIWDQRNIVYNNLYHLYGVKCL